MPIEDLEAKIKAVMAKSKTALAAQPAPAPIDARAAASAFAAAPPPPVAAAPAPPEPEPAALLDAVFGGDGDVAAAAPPPPPEPAAAPEPTPGALLDAVFGGDGDDGAAAAAFAPPAPQSVVEVTPAASPTPAPAVEAPPPPPTYSHDPEDLKPTPPMPPKQPLGRVVADDPPPPVVEPVPVPEKSIYERAIAAAAASPRRKAPERGRQRMRGATPKRAPSPSIRHKVDPAAQRLYDRAAEVRRKLEEKRKQRPPKCTFQPKIDAVSKKVAAAAASMAPRHERLHGDAERRRAALRARIETQQRREQQAHTPRMLTRGKPTKWSAKKRSDALHAHAAAIRDRLAAQRAREASQPRGCTFTPVTTSRARSASPARRGVDASTRLHNKGAEMRANRVRERDAARKREIAGCSFTPRMATRARSASPAPRGRDVATRAATFERERQRRLRELRAKRDALERKDCSFRPRFHTQPHDDESVNTSDTRTVARTTSRLAGTDTAARKTAFREAKLREQLAQHTFSPQIPSSRKVKTPKRDASPAPAHERLHAEGRDREAKRRDLREAQREKELESCPFRPSMPRRFSESDENAWDRLLDDGRDKKAVYEEVKRQQELDGCTFQPTTGDKSHLPLQTHNVPVEERLLATENQVYARVSRREAMKRDLELEGCTFQPVVGRPPRSRGESWEHESVASSHVEDTVSRLEEDVYRRRAASVERRRSARLSAEAERKARSVPVSPRVDPARLAALSKAKGGVNPARRKADLRRQREMNARPKVLDRPAPDFGARGTRVTTPRGNRAPSPRRTPRRSPSPGGRRAPSPSMRQRAPPPPPPPESSTTASSSMEEAPSHRSEFERWQSEMEAKLAAL